MGSFATAFSLLFCPEGKRELARQKLNPGLCMPKSFVQVDGNQIPSPCLPGSAGKTPVQILQFSPSQGVEGRVTQTSAADPVPGAIGDLYEPTWPVEGTCLATAHRPLLIPRAPAAYASSPSCKLIVVFHFCHTYLLLLASSAEGKGLGKANIRKKGPSRGGD